MLPPKEECDTGPYGIVTGETYMFAFSQDRIIKTGDPTILSLGYCDAPRDERYYKIEAKYLKSYSFKKNKSK